MNIYETDISKKYKTKQEIAYDEIKELIIDCKLEPNMQIVIKSIAIHMNISEIPIREALKRLISENFVVENNSNLTVAPITKEDFLDIIELRLGLEKIAIKIAARKMNFQKIEKLRDIITKMKSSFDSADLVTYDKLHMEFHLTICLMCEVAPLNSALKEAFEHHDRYKRYYNLQSWDTYPSFDAHEKIFSALKNKDAINAEKYLLENRIKAADRYKDIVKSII